MRTVLMQSSSEIITIIISFYRGNTSPVGNWNKTPCLTLENKLLIGK